MAKVIPLIVQFDHSTQFDASAPASDFDDAVCRRSLSSRQVTPHRHTLFISDPMRTKWDLLIILLTAYTCLAVPFQLSFQDAADLASVVTDSVVDLLFLIDIGLNCVTSYIDVATGQVVMARRQIVLDYFKSGRLFADLLTSVPFQLLGLLFQSLRSMKLLKLWRLLRLGRIIYHMRVSEQVKVPMRLSKVLLCILVYLHFLACAWHSLVAVERTWDPPYAVGPVRVPEYFSALYYAIATLVRFEVAPSTKFEALFCTCSIIAGSLVFTYLLGEITLLMARWNRGLGAFSCALDQVNTTMKNLKLSLPLQLRITSHFLATHKTLQSQREWRKFQRVIPLSWLQQINWHVYRHVFADHQLFSHFPQATEQLLKSLQYMFCTPDTHLIRQGTRSTCFYLVVAGHFEVWVENLSQRDCLVRELTEGDYCGEIGLLYMVKRTATVKATHYGNVGRLHAEAFAKLLQLHPELEARLKLRASQYADPYKVALQKTLRKISYLHHLDTVTLDRVLYTLKRRFFVEDSLVYENGARAEQLYIVMNGLVSVSMHIYDLTLQTRIHIKQRTIGTELRERSKHTLKRRTLRRRRIQDSAKLADLELARLEQGSILGATLVLFGTDLQTHCIALKDTEVLTLSAADLDSIAKEDVKLLIGMCRAKQRFTQYNALFDEAMAVPPVVDCYRCFRCETRDEIRSWRTLLRLRNAVLMVVLRNRQRIQNRLFSFKAILDRLRAVAQAEEKGWVSVARKIEAGTLQPSAIQSAAFLSSDELLQPVLHQFALLTSRAIASQQQAAARAQQLAQVMNLSFSLRHACSLSIQEVFELVGFVEQLVSN